ncbi:MAG: alpha/beta hydrolase [Parvularculaceae bacterium]|nr:alpha/beta hydrolase [Parvularculaceae bacterium]
MDGRLAALGAVLLALLSACQLTSVPDANQPRFEVAAPDGDFPVSVPSSFDATLGWLVVSENREKKAGSEIRLPVAIIHSQAETKKSPVVYLAGGPGTSAMRTAAFPGAYPWLQDRDFIVIGQRGTHFAKPALMCPEYREAVAKDQDTVAAITNCNERLQATGIELEHYNSITSAQDLEDLRSVLNIERWSFYAGSYGTRLALIYAKSYGDRLEAMVLDSPLPPNAIYDDESADNLETALRAVAQDCAQSPDCAAAFPDLETRFFQTLEATSTTPVQLDGSDRTVSTPQLVSLVPMTSEAGLRQAPMTMDRIAKLDPALLNRLAGPSAASDFAWGMRLSVWCAEALPFSRRSTSSAPDPVLGGYESAAVLPRLCKAWGVPALDESVVEPVVSDVPTLIIAGEFDPLTPPIWGKRAAETLSQSQVIVIRGGGHSSTQQWGGDG